MSSDNNLNNLLATKKSLTRMSADYFSPSAQKWLHEAQQAITLSDQISEDLGLYSAMAKRKLGAVIMEHAADLNTVSPPLSLQHWSSADAGRIILLITAIEHNPDQTEAIIRAYFKMGDEAEHIALIRSLMIFSPAQFLTELALDAGRTNSLELLSALTQDNPYPAAFYSESEFNQMVLKGLFLGLAIKRIIGISQRANPDLTRMGENYVIERENAGRTVPVDIWLTIGPYASETGRQQMIKYLTHDEIGHRYYCTLTLIQRLEQDPDLSPILKQRMDIEKDPIISKLLQDSL